MKSCFLFIRTHIGALSLGVRQSGRQAAHSSESSVSSKGGDLYLKSPIWLYGVQKDNFTIIIIIVVVAVVLDTRNTLYAITNLCLQLRAMFSRSGSQWMDCATWRNGVKFNRYSLLVETAVGLYRTTYGLLIV